MDKIIVAALQEFDLIDFPETLEGFAEPEKILEFVCVRLAEVKVRVSLENIESGYSVEYQKPAAAMKEKLAYEMFNMMKTHPLVRLLLAEACPQSIIDPCPP